MLTHRGIVVSGSNYNMLEGVGDSNNPIDLREIIATLGTWPDLLLAREETDAQKYTKLYNAFDKVNWVLVNTIGYDLIYKLYTNNERTLVFKDDNGDPVITIVFDDIPMMWYVTYNLAPGGSYASFEHSAYANYDLQYPVGIKFRMLANSTADPFTVTAIRHSDNHTERFTVYPKKYFIDDFTINDMGTTYAAVYLHGFCTDDAIDSQDERLMPNFKRALTNPVSLYHEIYTYISSGIVTDKLYILTGTSQVTPLDPPDIYRFDVIKYDNGNPALGWGASNINFEDYIIPEVGYMNELANRFSPRVHSNGIGLYVVPPEPSESPEEINGIRDITEALVKTNLTDMAACIFATNPAQCVINIKWYYGLKGAIDNIKSQNLYDMIIGPIQLTTDLVGSTKMHARYARTEFVEWHTSKLNVPAHFNNYLDFRSSYKLYLPYYGFIDIDPNDIVGGTIQVFYNINLVSGATMITIACNNPRNANTDTKYYSVSCTVGEDVPFGADIMKYDLLTFAQTAGKAATFAFSFGGAGMGAVAASAGSQVAQATSLLNDIGNEPGTDTSKIVEARDKAQSKYNTATTLGGIGKGVEAASSITPNVNVPARSNGSNPEVGTLDELHPYLLITRPVNVEPADYEDYVGLPSSQAVALSTCNGFTQVAAIKPQSMTDAPKYFNEIMSLLQAGVYL